MALTLFEINGNDLTDFMDIQNYDVQKEPIYEEWTDGNYVKHRNVVRTRIKGKFKLGFRDSTDVSAFLTVLANNVQPGNYYVADVFTNDDNTLNSNVSVFLSDVAMIKRDLVNARVWHEYTLEVEER